MIFPRRSNSISSSSSSPHKLSQSISRTSSTASSSSTDSTASPSGSAELQRDSSDSLENSPSSGSVFKGKPQLDSRRTNSSSNIPRSEDLELAASVKSIIQSIGIDDADIPEQENEDLNLGESIWEEKGVVLFTESDGKKVVKGGNLNQLLIYLLEESSTASSTENINDNNFADAFLLILQTILTPYQFARKLFERYDVPPCPEGVDPDVYETDVKLPAQSSVIKVMRKWLSARFDQDVNENEALLNELTEFAENVLSKDYPDESNRILSLLSKDKGPSKIMFLRGLSTSSFSRSNVNQIYKSFYISHDPIRGYPKFESLINFDVKELAAQMVLLDLRFFRAIRIFEFVGQAWEKNRKKAPRLIRFITHCNRVTNWVIDAILSEESPKNRAKIYTNMVQLLPVLKGYGDFMGIMTILSGLNSASISRLKSTLKEVSSKIIKIQQGFLDLMSANSSFKVYRAVLRATPEGRIPFLGVTMSDLTFMEDGNPDFIEGGLINFQKKALLANTLMEIAEYQKLCRHEIQETEMSSSFVKRVYEAQGSAKQFYEKSLRLEPRQSN